MLVQLVVALLSYCNHWWADQILACSQLLESMVGSIPISRKRQWGYYWYSIDICCLLCYPIGFPIGWRYPDAMSMGPSHCHPHPHPYPVIRILGVASSVTFYLQSPQGTLVGAYILRGCGAWLCHGAAIDFPTWLYHTYSIHITIQVGMNFVIPYHLKSRWRIVFFWQCVFQSQSLSMSLS